ncbi:MAG: ABC transporter substrate-binding protein, partial [Actinomycetota bacterium]
MSDLPLSLACGPYDRNEALRTGAIKPEGIDLTYIAIQSPPEIFTRMIDFKSFDASEMSLSGYLQMRSRGQEEFVAIPVFPSRVFRHGFIFVRDHIENPKDLENSVVGVPEYWQTAAVWIRGILQHEYGVDLRSIEWREGGVDVPLSSQEQNLRKAAGGYRPEMIPEGQCLSDQLALGSLDAVIGARKPASVGTVPGLRRLFPNYREVEAEYFKRTGIFPIMHTLVIRTELYERHPWVAESLFKAFQESKKMCLDQMRFTGTIRYTLPWLFSDLEEIDDIFAGDPWPYGFTANRKVLETFATYLHEQGFIAEAIDIGDFFTPILD